MAIVFDAKSTGGAANGNSSVTFSHTCTGSNLALFVGVTRDQAGTASVTYNGVAMTLIYDIEHDVGPSTPKVALFGLKNPSTGANNVVASFGGTHGGSAISVSFTGVDQTTGWHNSNTNIGSDVTPTVNVTSASGEMVVDAGFNNSSGTAATPGAGQTTINQFAAQGLIGGRFFMSYEDGGATVTMSWTTANDNWGTGGVSIIPNVTTGGVSSLTVLGVG